MDEFKSNPAPLVEITYLKEVTSPDYKTGKKDSTKSIERHWAQQLVAEGYARFTAESEEKTDGNSGQDESAPGAGS